MSTPTITHKINGQVWEPFNLKELTIDLNFDKGDPDASQLSFSNVRFTEEAAEGVFAIIESFGFFEGAPYEVTVSNQSYTKTFQMYIDTTEDHSIQCHDIVFTLKSRGSLDWFNEVIDSFGPEFLYKHTALLPAAYFKPVPYVLSTVPNYQQAVIAAIAGSYMVNTLADQVGKISSAVTQLLNPFGVDELIKAISIIVYFIILMIAYVKLVLDLYSLLIQPVKYHFGMYFKDTFTVICQHLGFNFKSSMFAPGGKYEKLFLLPRKHHNPKDAQDDRILGFLSPTSSAAEGYYKGTAGDWFRANMAMFNAKVVIEGQYLVFERRDYNNSSATYIIPALKTNGYRLNTAELISNYIIDFATDVTEKNTIDNFEGNVCQATTTLITTQNADLRLLKNSKRVSLPWSLATRKTDLEVPEKILSAFLTAMGGIISAASFVINGVIQVANTIIDVINQIDNILSFFGINVNINIPSIPAFNPPNLGQIINDRIGMLLLETDIMSVDKVFIFDENPSNPRESNIPVNNRTLLSARALWDEFHSIESFVPTTSNPNGNQWKTYNLENVEFCLEDLSKVEDNNLIFDSAGNIAKIESLSFNVWTGLASMRYRVNELYSNNLKIDIDEATGA